MRERLSRAGWLAASLLVIAVAGAASWRGLHNGFAFDDLYVVQHNARVHSLDGIWQAFTESYWPKRWATDGYRPLTIVAFALQWAAADGAPWIFHATSIALYAVSALLVLWIGTMLLPPLWAIAGAVLFAAHPVHVEAVANVVGQSELWVGCLLLLATGCYLRWRAEGELTTPRWVAIGAMLVTGTLFKEHALVLPAVLLLAECTVVRDARPLRQRLTALRPAFLSLVLAAVALIGLRTWTLGEVAGFKPYYPFVALGTDVPNRLLTVLNVVPEWVRLLFWPARLAIDYTPNDIEIATGFGAAQLPGIMLTLGILGLGIVAARRLPLAAFGIGFFILTLLPSSNVLVPAGVVIAERTLFLPSVGAILAVTAALALLRRQVADARLVPSLAGALALFALLGVWRSNSRTAIWKDNDTLLRSESASHPDSYRINFLRGAWHYERNDKRQGEPYLQRALAIFPLDPYAALVLAEGYGQSGLWAPAARYYRWATDVQPGMSEMAYVSLSLAEARAGNRAIARSSALEGMKHFGATTQLRRALRLAEQHEKEDVTQAGVSVDAGQADDPGRRDEDGVRTGKVPRASQNTR